MNKKLNIFNTTFGIRANLKSKELEIQQFWKDINLFSLLPSNYSRPRFVCHFGPPYANGNIHIGHALNFILKDITLRFHQMQGKKIQALPGWDTHGLPIAIAVTKKYPTFNHQPLIFRATCLQFAKDQIQNQIAQLQRLGLQINFHDYYQTFTKEYVGQQLMIFAQLVKKDLIFPSQKPVFWSWSSKTALAETEVDYVAKTTTAVYFFVSLCHNNIFPKEAMLLLWTTTPWTIPENRLIAVDVKAKYLAIRVSDIDKTFVCAKKLLKALVEVFNWQNVVVINEYYGKTLLNLSYQHPYLPRQGYLVHGDYVHFNEGTGLVHVAPAFGLDDYSLAQKNRISFECAIDDNGYFNAHAADPKLQNVFYSDSELIVIEQLKKYHRFLHQYQMVHQYPHDWRTKKPVIYRTTCQWYLNLQPLQKSILTTINQIQWTPQWGKKRMHLTLKSRKDWCLSRQRSWGTPIPIFINRHGNFVLKTTLVEHIANLIRQHGDSIWWKWNIKQLLTKTQIEQDQIVDKLNDTFDVWFDSGCSAFITQSQPINIIWEGTDQFRGWFNALIIISSALGKSFPISHILTHGFVNDAKGHKMSKSLGNVIDPNTICRNWGADVLRLWVISGNYFEDVNISESIIAGICKNYAKIRNTMRFLINNLVDFDAKTDTVPASTYPDYWILMRLNLLLQKSKIHFINYNYHLFYLELMKFMTINLSNLYFDYAKTTLYTDLLNSPYRRQIQTVFAIILEKLLFLLTPILPHTAEEIYQTLPHWKKKASVHLANWPNLDSSLLPQSASAQRTIMMKSKFIAALKLDVDKVIEIAIQQKLIDRPEEAVVYFFPHSHYQLFASLKEYKSFLQDWHMSDLAQNYKNCNQKWKKEDISWLEEPNLALLFRVHCLRIATNLGKQLNTGTISVVKVAYPLCQRCWFKKSLNKQMFCSRCQQILNQ